VIAGAVDLQEWNALFMQLGPTFSSTLALFASLLLVFILSPGISPASTVAPAAHAVFVDAENGDDYAADGSRTAPFATVLKGIRAAWQSVQVNVKVNDATLRLFDAAVLWADNQTTYPVVNRTATLIVDNRGMFNQTPDMLLFLRLESLGYRVTVVDDNTVAGGGYTIADAGQQNLLVISESGGSSNMDNLIGVGIPVVNLNGGAWDNWHMSGPAENNTVGAQIAIVDDTTSLAAGFSGDLTVYSAPFIILHAAAASLTTGAQVVATLPGDPTRACLFAIEAGTPLLNAVPAPARRVAFFLFSRPRTVDATPYTFMDRNAALDQEVIFAAGTYPVESTIDMNLRTVLRGGWNSAFDVQDPAVHLSTLDGLRERHIAEFSGSGSSNCTIEGFRLINGRRFGADLGGGAIYADGGSLRNARIRRCTFFNNSTEYRGGAVYAIENETEMFFEDCVFTSNTSPNGLAVATNNGPKLSFERCLFTENVNPDGGRSVLYHASGAVRAFDLINCIFTDNLVGGPNSRLIELNGGNQNDRICKIYNCTFYGNTVDRDLIYDLTNDSPPVNFRRISNNIAVGNTAAGAAEGRFYARLVAKTGPSNPDIVSSNLVFGNTNMAGGLAVIDQDGNFAADPLFVNPSARDLRLRPASPAIDAGLDLAEVPGDFIGTVRPRDASTDLGAFEYDSLLQRTAAEAWLLY
jgi:hypothetical protein